MKTHQLSFQGRASSGLIRLVDALPLMLSVGFLAASSCVADSVASPSSGWTLTGSLNVPRAGHTATLLADGSVLVAGGYTIGGMNAGAEIYDPITGMWTATGNMSKGRSSHAAVLLEIGEVLVAGTDAPPNETADVYNPTTGAWMLTGNLPIAVQQTTLTLLSDGKAIVAGGLNPDGVSHDSTIYDPLTGTWAAAEHVNGDHGFQTTATRLLDGRVLLVGGFDDSFMPIANVDLYQPAD